MQDLERKVAVVTGAASGIGLAMARRFAQEGMKVALADVEAPALEAAAQDLRQHGYEVTAILTDVSKAEAVRQLARTVLEAYGRVHVLCNNAGVSGPMDRAIWEATEKDWHWTFDVNFWGIVRGVSTFLPIMLQQGDGGHIVNTASTTGLTMAANLYGVSKHAVVGFSEAIYAQLKQAGGRVGVSVLCPGFVNTSLFEGRQSREALRDAESGPESPPGIRCWARASLALAIDPAHVAEMVVDAIRRDQFYVLTDSDWDGLIRERFNNILGRRNPAATPGRPSEASWPWPRSRRPRRDGPN